MSNELSVEEIELDFNQAELDLLKVAFEAGSIQPPLNSEQAEVAKSLARFGYLCANHGGDSTRYYPTLKTRRTLKATNND
jgi:hypothetical protein